jgi:hypothetical protein
MDCQPGRVLFHCAAAWVDRHGCPQSSWFPLVPSIDRDPDAALRTGWLWAVQHH